MEDKMLNNVSAAASQKTHCMCITNSDSVTDWFSKYRPSALTTRSRILIWTLLVAQLIQRNVSLRNSQYTASCPHADSHPYPTRPPSRDRKIIFNIIRMLTSELLHDLFLTVKVSYKNFPRFNGTSNAYYVALYHPVRCNMPDNTWWGVKVLSSSLCSFLQSAAASTSFFSPPPQPVFLP
jgi:hypothetical protein